jgi:hypothetical protein
MSKYPSRRRPSSQYRANSPSHSPIEAIFPTGPPSGLPTSSSGGSQPTISLMSAWKAGVLPNAKPIMNAPLGQIRENLPLPFTLQQPEEQTDNWDDDFEEGISLTKLQGT